MGIDCLAKATGYDRALDKQAAGLVREVVCDPSVREPCHNWGRCFGPFSASGCRALKSPTSKWCPPLRSLRDGPLSIAALGADL